MSDIKRTISAIGRKPSSSRLPVNLIRQWCYCPRKVYYFELTDFKVEYPTWVRQGEDFHQLEEKLWNRRNLSRFDLESGKLHHNLTVKDDELGLHGIVDMAIETGEAVYAVEFKISASSKKRGDRLQLVAYSMLLEKHFSKPSPVGFLVGKGKVLHTIDIDKNQRQQVLDVVSKMRQMLSKGLKPRSSATVVQCCACEYLNFCNDRL